MSKYHIYFLIDQKNIPYYVGQTKSFNQRRNAHLVEIRKENPIYHQHRKAKKLLLQGFSFRMEIVKTVDQEKLANFYEKKFIKELTKKGVKLCNSTSGGRIYFNHSLKTRKKMSKNNPRYWKGKKKSPESIIKMKETKRKYFETNPGHMKGKKASKEARAKMSKAKLGKKASKKTIKKLLIIRNIIKPHYTTFWKCTSPKKEVYICWGLGAFCRKFKLCQAHMFSVSKGDRPHHKNWTCLKVSNISNELKSKAKSKGYILVRSS